MTQESLMNLDVRWKELVEAHLAYMEALRQFWMAKEERIPSIKRGLQQGDWATAMHLLSFLSSEEQTLLFDELMKLAIYSQGYGQAAREAIAAMPKAWVRTRIDLAIDPYLHSGEYDVYQGVLELLLALDYEGATKVANMAVQHTNPDIQEVGRDFLERLTKVSKVI